VDGKSHQVGHRERLRARFRKGGIDAVHDYELLELILFRAVPRRDVKSIAKVLIKKFGSLASVISAEPQRLKEVKGIGDSIVTEMKIVQAAAVNLLHGKVLDRPAISSWSALLDYCQASMAFSRTEQFRILYLDRKNYLIADEIQQEGTVDHTPVYPREVVKRALELGASSIILVHNHPTGDPTPSSADIEMTKEVVEAARSLKISVHDHLIIGQGKHSSFKALGLL